MSNPFEARLQAAFAPLLERAGWRVKRLTELRAQPATEARDKSIAAETREIKLIKEAATVISAIITDAGRTCHLWELRAESVKARAVQAHDEATRYEDLFTRAVMLLPPLSDTPIDPFVVRVQRFIDSPRSQERLSWPIEKRQAASRITSAHLAIQANPQLTNQFKPY